MTKYKVEQLVMCEVRVWYTVEAPNHSDAVLAVAKNNCPTCAEGRDFEIISDNEIKYTLINGFNYD